MKELVAGRSDIESALSALLDDQRTALLLVVLEGLTYRGRGAGRNDSHVTWHLAAARGAIKNILEGDIAAHSLAAAPQPQDPPARPSDVRTPSACVVGFWKKSRDQCEAGSRPLLIQSELCVSSRVVWVSICR
jgi:hypothetical protein